jgi:D-aspartate ligase
MALLRRGRSRPCRAHSKVNIRTIAAYQRQKMSSPRPPALLCDATFYGTLAAVRSLGRDGVPVAVVDSGRIAPASWSRYAVRRLRGPPAADAKRLLEWLRRFGTREERHVVYPTSDELVFLLSKHRGELAKTFALYQPDLRTTLRVLDKRKLLEAARSAGVDSPPTWFPETLADVDQVARDDRGPLMFKPRSQLFLVHHGKGAVVRRDRNGLRDGYERFCRANVYGAEAIAHLPEITRPMVQRYYPDASEGIYSLSGFRDRSGRHTAMLGSLKVLQRPRRLGVGLCFESAPVAPCLRARAERLLDELGYFGVFELEFIRSHGDLLLIDMNPRFYNQLQLDIARGLDLPRLAYAAALGDDTEVARLVGLAHAASKRDEPRAFCNSIGLQILLGAQRAFGTMSTAEAARWHDWRRDQRDMLVDAIASDDDPGPLVSEGMGELYRCLRHPRSFLRMIALEH